MAVASHTALANSFCPAKTPFYSKFDAHRERIEELLRLGVSVRKIAHKHLGIKNHAALNTYVKKRRLRPEAQ